MTIDVKALRALAEAASGCCPDGPWGTEYRGEWIVTAGKRRRFPSSEDGSLVAESWAEEIAEFIAAAHNAIPELLDLVELQAAEIERHRALVAQIGPHVSEMWDQASKSTFPSAQRERDIFSWFLSCLAANGFTPDGDRS